MPVLSKETNYKRVYNRSLRLPERESHEVAQKPILSFDKVIDFDQVHYEDWKKFLDAAASDEEKSDLDHSKEICEQVSGPMEQGLPTVPLVEIQSYKSSMSKLDEIRGYLSEVLCTGSSDSTNEEFVLGCVCTIVELFIAYGFDLRRHESEVIKKQMIAAIRLSLSSGLNYVKYFKTRIADFFSVWNGQELSKFPYDTLGIHPRYLLGGPFYSFTLRLARDPVTMMSFTNSILLSKKGMPRASDAMVEKAVDDNIDIMTTKKKKAEPVVYEWTFSFETLDFNTPIELSRSDVEHQITRTTQELFRKWQLTLEEQSRPFLPSSRSNFWATMQNGGTWGVLEQEEAFEHLRTELNGQHNQLVNEFTNIELCGFVSEYYGAKGEEEERENANTTKEVIGLEIPCEDFVAAFRKFYWRITGQALREEKLVQVIGLKEALKIRCISKGPPLTYFVLKPLQKSLWSHLKSMSAFQLIGEPISEELVNERFAKFLDGKHWFHSGDYSAATDGLFSWCSELVAKNLMDMNDKKNGFCNQPLRDLFLASLTGHTYVKMEKTQDPALANWRSLGKFETGAWRDEVPQENWKSEGFKYYIRTDLPQKRGQLMGSITSFPILCVLNFALMRWSYELAHSTIVKARDFNGWVNGDDCQTAYTNPGFPLMWERLALLFGFEKSLGKTYASNKFMSMNSTMYRIEGQKWLHVPYINLGLLHAVKRSEEKSKENKMLPTDLGVLHHKLMDTCPPSMKRQLTTMFLAVHKETLSLAKDIPWWLPNWMGGLGLQQQGEWNDYDRHVARAALEVAETDPINLSVDKDWLCYDLFNAYVKREGQGLVGKHYYTNYEGEEEFGKVYNAIVYRTWCQSDLTALFDPNLSLRDRRFQKTKAHWRLVQRNAERLMKSRGPLTVDSDDVFTHEKKSTVFPVRAIIEVKGLSQLRAL